MLWLDPPTSLFSLSQTSSDIWFGDRNQALSCPDIADCWLSKEYLACLIISQLEQTVTQWDATYYFSWFMTLTVYTPVCLLLHIKLQLELWTQWSLLKEAYNFKYKLWENHDLSIRGQPVISYIYLCEQWYANCLAYFSNPLPVMDWKLNWNIRLTLEKIYSWYLIIYRLLVLSFF